MHRFTLLLAAILGIALTGGAKKQPPIALRVYPESGEIGGQFSNPIQVLATGRASHMATMPLINESDIASVYPFPAPDGSGTYGAYFRLDSHGKNLLSQHTTSKRGTNLFVFINGRRITDLYVDRPVQDGLLSIPTGLTNLEADFLRYEWPPIGREGEKPPKRPKAPKPKKDLAVEA